MVGLAEKSAAELYNLLDLSRLPNHIAVIMDGNRRWAKKRFMPAAVGHKAGVEAFRTVMETCRNLGVKVLSAYAFSAENWQRSPAEVAVLMQLFEYYAKAERQKMLDTGVRLQIIGDKSALHPSVCRELEISEEVTAHNTDLILNLAVNYGGREEIVQAARRLAEQVKAGSLQPEEIDREHFASWLYTAGCGDPDLLIRTSGELRLSNFLLWQSAYTEFYFSDIYWPDVDEAFLYRAIIEYQQRGRRYGT
ncbi:MAG: isoprenyl transferase [Candidatus Bruticola sp.]